MTRRMQAAQAEQFGQPLVQKQLDTPTSGAVKITLLIKDHDAATLT